jgi:hypothetical protein
MTSWYEERKDLSSRSHYSYAIVEVLYSAFKVDGKPNHDFKIKFLYCE